MTAYSIVDILNTWKASGVIDQLAKLNDIDDKLATNNTTLNAVNTAVSQDNTDISEINAGVQEQITSLGSIDDKLTTNNTTLSEINVAAYSSNLTLNQVNTTLGQVNTEAHNSNSTLNQVNTTLGQVNTEAHNSNLVLNQVNTVLGQVNTTLTQVNTTLGQVNTTLTQVNTGVQDSASHLNLVTDDPDSTHYLNTLDMGWIHRKIHKSKVHGLNFQYLAFPGNTTTYIQVTVRDEGMPITTYAHMFEIILEASQNATVAAYKVANSMFVSGTTSIPLFNLNTALPTLSNLVAFSNPTNINLTGAQPLLSGTVLANKQAGIGIAAEHNEIIVKFEPGYSMILAFTNLAASSTDFKYRMFYYETDHNG